MKKFLVASLLALAVLPATAVAKAPTARHVGVYYYLRRHVEKKLGHRADGRNIVRLGLSNGRRASDAVVRASSAVMDRMLWPPVYRAPAVMSTPSSASATHPTFYAGDPPAAPSGLESCIISHESGGNPQATNGQYAGIGQWAPGTWLADGGGQYASSPLGATYDQQLSVLTHEGTSGMISQQGVYDGCA